MTRDSGRIPPLAVLAFALAVPSVEAQIARVFVSANGNDSNVCSNVATPCRTFRGGISQVSDNGEVIVLDSADYGGATISKGVTLDAPVSVTAFSSESFTIDAPDKVVVLRGLTLKSHPQANKAILVTAASSVSVENCIIAGWAIAIDMGSGGYLRMTDTLVRDSGLGIFLSGSTVATIDRCRFERNPFSGANVANGARVRIRDTVMIGGGLLVQAGASTSSEAAVDGCLFTDSPGRGVSADGTGGGVVTVSISSSTIVGCNEGLASSQTLAGTATIFASNLTVTGNNTGLLTSGGASILSRGNNTVEANTTNGAFTGSFAPR
jgi:hypothetical protein